MPTDRPFTYKSGAPIVISVAAADGTSYEILAAAVVIGVREKEQRAPNGQHDFEVDWGIVLNQKPAPEAV
jgi:hypothetical protein